MLDCKVRKVCNSLEVALSKETLSRQNVQDGDTVFLIKAPDASYQITPL